MDTVFNYLLLPSKLDRTSRREIALGTLAEAELVLRLSEDTYQAFTRTARLAGRPAEVYFRGHARRILELSDLDYSD